MRSLHPPDVNKTHLIAYRDFRVRSIPRRVSTEKSRLSVSFRELQGAQVVDSTQPKASSTPSDPRARGSVLQTRGESDTRRLTRTLQGLTTTAVLAFLLFTGCRISEALAVKVSDIEDRGSVKVVCLRGKGDKLRVLPLHPKLSKVISELVARREKKADDFLFTRVKGATADEDHEPLRRQSVGELLKSTLKRLGLDTNRSLHSSRRTVISNLLENGSRIESVAELAGHANINTTQKYNVRKEELEDNPLLSLRYQD